MCAVSSVTCVLRISAGHHNAAYYIVPGGAGMTLQLHLFAFAHACACMRSSALCECALPVRSAARRLLEPSLQAIHCGSLG